MNLDPEKKPAFWIGSVPISGDLILAPIDGYTDSPYRAVARAHGSAMSTTEFINAMDVLNGHPRLEQRISFAEDERPVVFQLLDNDPERLLVAAQKLRPRQPDLFDINIGCPARSVAGRGAGAGLMRSPEKISHIFSRLSKEIDIPVTAKIRLGWDLKSQNYLEIAHIIEDNGGKLITLHGRTRQQAYGGLADWDAIAAVKQVLTIPVIGNGDVRNPADIRKMKEHTGCDGIMIGRGAIGNPWIFSRKDRHLVSATELFKTVQNHLERMQAYYGRQAGLVFFRKHAVRYLAPNHLPRETYVRLITCGDEEEFLALLAKSLGI